MEKETEYAIEIINLRKSFGKLKAVDGISFKIKKGEFFGYLGPNGAGKTTTIESIAGLNNFQGEIKIFGKDVVKDYQETRRLIGLSQQDFNLDLFFTVEKVLLYQAGFFGIPKKEAEKRVDEILEQLNLKDKKKTDITKLSGGMKRRLMLARALIHSPKILILDEPTAGVDLELRHELWAYLKKLNKQGVTILLTTHYLEEVEILCNRIGIINHGKIIALDDKEKLKKKLSDTIVKIKLKEKLRQIPEVLKKYNFQLKDKSLCIDCKSNTAPKIIEELLKAGLKMDSFEIKESTLEEIFLKLTKRDNENNKETNENKSENNKTTEITTAEIKSKEDNNNNEK